MPPAFLTARYAAKGFVVAIVALIVVASLLFAAWQQVRISGLGVDLPLIGHVGFEGYEQRNARLKADLESVLVAQADARDEQLAVNDAAAAIYEQVSERIDENAQIQSSAAHAAAGRYIADFRVRCPAQGFPGRATAAAPDNGPGRAEEPSAMPELAGVLVSERDIRICTDNTVMAIAGHRLATELEAASRPEAIDEVGDGDQ